MRTDIQPSSDATPQPTWLDNPLWVMAALTLCSALLIAYTFNRPFYKFDDSVHLQMATEAPLSDLANISNGETLFPVASLALRLDRFMFGPPFSETIFVREGHEAHPINDYYVDNPSLWASGTRITNALSHALAGLMIWLLLRRLNAGSGVAFWVAAAWAVHPMACESVCWISEKKNVLSALFGFAALLAWCWRACAWRRVVLSSFLFLLACLSKPTAVGFLPVFFALEILLQRESSDPLPTGSARFWLGCAGRLAGPVTVAAVIIGVNLHIHMAYFVEPAGGSVWTALMTDCEIFSYYVFNLVAPVNLSMFYGLEPIISLGDPRVWLYGAFIAVFFVLAIGAAQGRDRWLAAFGTFWFFAALGPAANIATIPYWMQDRYVYISAPGFLLALACGANGFFARAGRVGVARTAGITMLAIFAVLAVVRSASFVDSHTLFMEAAERQPLSGMAQLYALKHHSKESFKADKLSGEAGQRLRNEEAKLAYIYYKRALACPDLTNFKSEFDLRVMMADHLMAMQKLSLAKECLEGWVPPPHLSMREPGKSYTDAAKKKYYEPGTLALAWMIEADIHLREAALSDLGTTKEAFDQRKRLCAQALEDLQKAAAIRSWKTELDERRKKIETVLARIEKDAAGK